MRNNTECYNRPHVAFATPASAPSFVWPRCENCPHDSETEIYIVGTNPKQYVYFCTECFLKLEFVKPDDEATT